MAFSIQAILALSPIQKKQVHTSSAKRYDMVNKNTLGAK